MRTVTRTKPTNDVPGHVSPTGPDSDPHIPPRLARPGLALGLMVAAQFIVILDFSIVNVALPSIQRSLRFSAVGVEGVITAYATAFGGLLVLGGRLADLLGRRRMFVSGLLLFAATSALCALASSPVVLVVARAAQGVAAALLAPSALALLTTTFPEGAARNRALGVFGAATAAGFVAGQVLGGVLTDVVGWRAIFAVNVPVGVLAALLAVRTLDADGDLARRRMPDIPGAVLVTIAMGLLVWAPTRGADRGWGSTAFLIPLAGAIVAASAFAGIETRREDPLLRLGMLRSRWLAGTSGATAVTGALNGAVVLLCTLFLQRVDGYSPLRAGLAFVPTGLAGLLIGTRYAGPLITRFGVQRVLTAAAVVSAVAVIGLSRLPTDYALLLPSLVVIGASFTTAAVATTVAVSTGVAAHEQGMAAGLRQTSFQIGVGLGVAVMLSIASSHTNALLHAAHAPSQATALTSGYRFALVLLGLLSAAGGLIAAATLRPQAVPDRG
jgi:EmrB/QacA subfamily drug resistance transporter